MSSKQTEQERIPMIVSTTTTTTTALVETNHHHHHHRDLTILQNNRDNWSNRVVYLLSIIGFVVDLGRILLINRDYYCYYCFSIR